jgi:hypothetical protein
MRGAARRDARDDQCSGVEPEPGSLDAFGWARVPPHSVGRARDAEWGGRDCRVDAGEASRLSGVIGGNPQSCPATGPARTVISVEPPRRRNRLARRLRVGPPNDISRYLAFAAGGLRPSEVAVRRGVVRARHRRRRRGLARFACASVPFSGAALRGTVRFRFWTLAGGRWAARGTELHAFAVCCGSPDADQVEMIEREVQTFRAHGAACTNQESFDRFGSAKAEPPPRRIRTAGGTVLSSRLSEGRMLFAAHLHRPSSRPDVIPST